MDADSSNQRNRDVADDVEPCGIVNSNGDLPWPLSVKVLPEEDDKQTHARVAPIKAPGIPAGKTKLCQANFNYKGNVKLLQWQGPQGGNSLLDIIRNAYAVEDHKLIYLTDGKSSDVLDVDQPLSEGIQYQVRVEPEDSSPFNIVPCIVNMCTFRYAADGK